MRRPEMSADMQLFGAQLRAARIRRSYTLRRMGEETGVSETTVSRVERGLDATGDTIVRLARWAKIDLVCAEDEEAAGGES